MFVSVYLKSGIVDDVVLCNTFESLKDEMLERGARNFVSTHDSYVIYYEDPDEGCIQCFNYADHLEGKEFSNPYVVTEKSDFIKMEPVWDENILRRGTPIYVFGVNDEGAPFARAAVVKRIDHGKLFYMSSGGEQYISMRAYLEKEENDYEWIDIRLLPIPTLEEKIKV